MIYGKAGPIGAGLFEVSGFCLGFASGRLDYYTRSLAAAGCLAYGPVLYVASS